MQTTLEAELKGLFEPNKTFQKNGFHELFTKYVSQDVRGNVAWEKIKKPPPDSVCVQNFNRIKFNNVYTPTRNIVSANVVSQFLDNRPFNTSSTLQGTNKMHA